MENFIDYCKNVIKENLFNFIDKEVCIDEFSYDITENATFKNTDKAKEFINEWWNEAAEFVDNEYNNGCEISNYFRDPKQFMINMVRWGVACLITDCTFIKDKWGWGDTIVIKEKDIENMWKEIENMKEMTFD